MCRHANILDAYHTLDDLCAGLNAMVLVRVAKPYITDSCHGELITTMENVMLEQYLYGYAKRRTIYATDRRC